MSLPSLFARPLPAALVLTLGLVPAWAVRPLAAQTIVGTLVEDGPRRPPIADADVSLLDQDGQVITHVLSDEHGHFRLAPPEPGSYYVVASRLGYETAASRLLTLSGEGTQAIKFLVQAAPVAVEGLTVEVAARLRAERTLMQTGVRVEDLHQRFMGPDDIAAVRVKRDVGSVLEWRGIGGLTVIRPENLRPGSANVGLCVALDRARDFMGEGHCALMVLDGRPISGIEAQLIDPETISSMAVLTPQESFGIFGGVGAAGAVMMWTTDGR